MSFNINVELINLLRNPKFDNNLCFDLSYMKELHQVVHSIAIEYKIKQEERIYVIYMHLAISLIENLKDMTDLGALR